MMRTLPRRLLTAVCWAPLLLHHDRLHGTGNSPPAARIRGRIPEFSLLPVHAQDASSAAAIQRLDNELQELRREIAELRRSGSSGNGDTTTTTFAEAAEASILYSLVYVVAYLVFHLSATLVALVGLIGALIIARKWQLEAEEGKAAKAVRSNRDNGNAAHNDDNAPSQANTDTNTDTNSTIAKKMAVQCENAKTNPFVQVIRGVLSGLTSKPENAQWCKNAMIPLLKESMVDSLGPSFIAAAKDPVVCDAVGDLFLGEKVRDKMVGIAAKAVGTPSFIKNMEKATGEVIRGKEICQIIGDAVVNTLLDDDVRRLVRDVLLEEMQDEKLHAICVSGVKTGVVDAVQDAEFSSTLKILALDILADPLFHKAIMQGALGAIKQGIIDALQDEDLQLIFRNSLAEALQDEAIHRATFKGAMDAILPSSFRKQKTPRKSESKKSTPKNSSAKNSKMNASGDEGTNNLSDENSSLLIGGDGSSIGTHSGSVSGSSGSANEAGPGSSSSGAEGGPASSDTYNNGLTGTAHSSKKTGFYGSVGASPGGGESGDGYGTSMKEGAASSSKKKRKESSSKKSRDEAAVEEESTSWIQTPFQFPWSDAPPEDDAEKNEEHGKKEKSEKTKKSKKHKSSKISPGQRDDVIDDSSSKRKEKIQESGELASGGISSSEEDAKRKSKRRKAKEAQAAKMRIPDGRHPNGGIASAALRTPSQSATSPSRSSPSRSSPSLEINAHDGSPTSPINSPELGAASAAVAGSRAVGLAGRHDKSPKREKGTSGKRRSAGNFFDLDGATPSGTPPGSSLSVTAHSVTPVTGPDSTAPNNAAIGIAAQPAGSGSSAPSNSKESRDSKPSKSSPSKNNRTKESSGSRPKESKRSAGLSGQEAKTPGGAAAEYSQLPTAPASGDYSELPDDSPGGSRNLHSINTVRQGVGFEKDKSLSSHANAGLSGSMTSSSKKSGVQSDLTDRDSLNDYDDNDPHRSDSLGSLGSQRRMEGFGSDPDYVPGQGSKDAIPSLTEAVTGQITGQINQIKDTSEQLKETVDQHLKEAEASLKETTEKVRNTFANAFGGFSWGGGTPGGDNDNGENGENANAESPGEREVDDEDDDDGEDYGDTGGADDSSPSGSSGTHSYESSPSPGPGGEAMPGAGVVSYPASPGVIVNQQHNTNQNFNLNQQPLHGFNSTHHPGVIRTAANNVVDGNTDNSGSMEYPPGPLGNLSADPNLQPGIAIVAGTEGLPDNSNSGNSNSLNSHSHSANSNALNPSALNNSIPMATPVLAGTSGNFTPTGGGVNVIPVTPKSRSPKSQSKASAAKQNAAGSRRSGQALPKANRSNSVSSKSSKDGKRR